MSIEGFALRADKLAPFVLRALNSCADKCGLTIDRASRLGRILAREYVKNPQVATPSDVELHSFGSEDGRWTSHRSPRYLSSSFSRSCPNTFCKPRKHVFEDCCGSNHIANISSQRSSQQWWFDCRIRPQADAPAVSIQPGTSAHGSLATRICWPVSLGSGR